MADLSGKRLREEILELVKNGGWEKALEYCRPIDLRFQDNVPNIPYSPINANSSSISRAHRPECGNFSLCKSKNFNLIEKHYGKKASSESQLSTHVCAEHYTFLFDNYM